jgi:hypothetical protein
VINPGEKTVIGGIVPCGALVQVPPDELRRWARENARSFFKQTA